MEFDRHSSGKRGRSNTLSADASQEFAERFETIFKEAYDSEQFQISLKSVWAVVEFVKAYSSAIYLVTSTPFEFEFHLEPAADIEKAYNARVFRDIYCAFYTFYRMSCVDAGRDPLPFLVLSHEVVDGRLKSKYTTKK